MRRDPGDEEVRIAGKRIIGIIIGLVFTFNAYAFDGKDMKNWVYFAAPPQNSLFVGMDIAELQQRNFTNIGLDNYTFHIGQRFDSTLPFALGWSFLAFHVDLSKEHIQNPAQVYCIEGDRSVLSGDTAEVDLWFDGSFNLLSFVKIGNCYLFRIVPEMGLGIGYGMWGFFNEKNKQSYKLEVMMLSTRINLRTSIFDLFYIDYPLWNFCIFLLKNRPAYGDLGDVKITRPETFGLRALMAVGITIKL